jgi:hypothetical protein
MQILTMIVLLENAVISILTFLQYDCSECFLSTFILCVLFNDAVSCFVYIASVIDKLINEGM